jgi:putative ABC transport system permease protein
LGGFLSEKGQIFANADTLAQLPQTGADLVVAREAAPNTALMDIALAQRLLNRDGGIDRLLVSPDQPLLQPPLAQVAPGLALIAPQQGNDVTRLTDSFHLNLAAFGLLSFAGRLSSVVLWCARCARLVPLCGG